MTVQRVEIQERVLKQSDEIAAGIRGRLAANRVVAYNLVSSPGSGKTSLLERTLE